MTTVPCPIWRTPATVVAEDYGRLKTYTSHRAGGKFTIVFQGDNWASKLGPGDCAKLTTYILDQNRVGQTPEIDSKRLMDVANFKSLSVAARADRLLEFIYSQAGRLGEFVEFMFSEKTHETTDAALAWSECVNTDELHFLLRALHAHGLASCMYKDQPDEVTVTIQGHARLAELAAANKSSSQAFVAMWFDSSTHSAYEEGIDPAIRLSGYLPLRIDRKETISKVDDEIVSEIRRSRFIVADFTSEPDKPRGGVYFEAGFAMGLNIPVIWTCRTDVIDKVHFDTRQFSHIVWTSPTDLKTKLVNRIGAVIGFGPSAELR